MSLGLGEGEGSCSAASQHSLLLEELHLSSFAAVSWQSAPCSAWEVPSPGWSASVEFEKEDGWKEERTFPGHSGQLPTAGSLAGMPPVTSQQVSACPAVKHPCQLLNWRHD